MSGNLPPGVTESMIPGNRPEDGMLEAAEEWLMDHLASANVSADEYKTVGAVGLAAVEEQRKAVDAAINEERATQAQAADAMGQAEHWDSTLIGENDESQNIA